MWRAVRVQEALALAEADLDPRRAALLGRQGKGGRRREVGMDAWLGGAAAWLDVRLTCPSGRFSAPSTVRPAADTGQVPPPAPTCAGRHSRPVSGGASHRTSS